MGTAQLTAGAPRHIRHPAIIAHLLVTAMLIALAVMQAPIGDTYGDIVTETMGLLGQNKLPDMLAYAAFVLAVLAQFLLYGIPHRAIIRRHTAALPSMRAGVWLMLTPPILALAPLLLPTAVPQPAWTTVILSLACLPLFLGVMATAPGPLTQRSVRHAAQFLVIGALGAVLSAAGVLVLLTHLGIADVFSGPLIGMALGAGAAILWFVVWGLAVRAGAGIRLARLFRWALIGIPLLCLHLLPYPLFLASTMRAEFGVAVHGLWMAVIGILFIIPALAWLAAVNRDIGRLLQRVPVIRPLTRRPLLILLLPVALFMTVGMQPAPILTEDWFHPAQFWLPAQQLAHFGAVPFVDLNADQGFASFYPATMNLLVSDGAPSLFMFSHAVLQALIAAVIVLIAGRAWGFFPALFIALLPAVEYKTQMMVLMAVALAAPRLWRKPLAWLCTWLPLALIAVTYVPMPGMAVFLASLPLVVVQMFRASSKTRLIFSGMLVVLSLAILLTPLRDIAFGYIAFILDQAATNTVALGIPLLNPQGPAPGAHLPAGPVIFNLFRFAWAPVLALLLAFHLWRRESLGQVERRSTLPLIILGGLTLLFFGYYALYRVEANELSRPWTASVLALGVFLIVILCRRPSWGQPSVYLAWLGSFALVINAGASAPWLGLEYLTARVGPRIVPAEYARSADPERFPAIAGLYAREHVLRHIDTFERILASGLPPRYYDFTDGPLRYYVHDRPVPAPYALWYNAHNERQQRDVIAALRDNNVAFILAGPILYPGDYTPALRAYRIYRHALDNFHAVAVREFTLLVRDDLSPRPQDDAARKQELDLLTPIYAMNDLKQLPATWGRSWDSLTGRFLILGSAYASASADGSVQTLPVPRKVERPDFLLIEGEWDNNGEGILALGWNDEWGEAPGVSMLTSANRLLVPIGSLPRWLRAHEIVEFQLFFDAANATGTEAVKVTFLKLAE